MTWGTTSYRTGNISKSQAQPGGPIHAEQLIKGS